MNCPKPYTILEIGPGFSPLCLEHPSAGPNWLHDGPTEYTAVQPILPDRDSFNNFPETCTLLPNVTLLRGYVQDVSLPDDYYDEVFMSNVLSDPSVARGVRDIVDTSLRVAKIGGLITMIETYTPDLGPQVESFTKKYGDKIEVARQVTLGDKYGGPMQPTAEWVDAVGPYSWTVRYSAETNSWVQGGRFLQIRRLI